MALTTSQAILELRILSSGSDRVINELKQIARAEREIEIATSKREMYEKRLQNQRIIGDDPTKRQLTWVRKLKDAENQLFELKKRHLYEISRIENQMYGLGVSKVPMYGFQRSMQGGGTSASMEREQIDAIVQAENRRNKFLTDNARRESRLMTQNEAFREKVKNREERDQRAKELREVRLLRRSQESYAQKFSQERAYQLHVDRLAEKAYSDRSKGIRREQEEIGKHLSFKQKLENKWWNEAHAENKKFDDLKERDQRRMFGSIDSARKEDTAREKKALKEKEEAYAKTFRGKIAGHLEYFGQIFKRVSFALGSFAIINGIITTMKTFVVGLVENNAKLELYETRLRVLTGSLQIARDRMVDLKRITIETPFVLEDLMQGFVKVTAFGQGTARTLESIADWASAMNETFTESAEAFGKISIGSPMSRRLLETRGIPWDIFQKNLRETKDRAEALRRSIDMMFGGTARESSKTFLGILSNISDTVFQIIARVGEIPFGAAKGFLSSLYDGLTSVNSALQKGAIGWKDYVSAILDWQGTVARWQVNKAVSMVDVSKGIGETNKESSLLAEYYKLRRTVIDLGKSPIVTDTESAQRELGILTRAQALLKDKRSLEISELENKYKLYQLDNKRGISLEVYTKKLKDLTSAEWEEIEVSGRRFKVFVPSAMRGSEVEIDLLAKRQEAIDRANSKAETAANKARREQEERLRNEKDLRDLAVAIAGYKSEQLGDELAIVKANERIGELSKIGVTIAGLDSFKRGTPRQVELYKELLSELEKIKRAEESISNRKERDAEKLTNEQDAFFRKEQLIHRLSREIARGELTNQEEIIEAEKELIYLKGLSRDTEVDQLRIRNEIAKINRREAVEQTSILKKRSDFAYRMIDYAGREVVSAREHNKEVRDSIKRLQTQLDIENGKIAPLTRQQEIEQQIAELNNRRISSGEIFTNILKKQLVYLTEMAAKYAIMQGIAKVTGVKTEEKFGLRGFAKYLIQGAGIVASAMTGNPLPAIGAGAIGSQWNSMSEQPAGLAKPIWSGRALESIERRSTPLLGSGAASRDSVPLGAFKGPSRSSTGQVVIQVSGDVYSFDDFTEQVRRADKKIINSVG